MGSYLVVDGRKNNTKSISFLMIGLLRDILPEKKSLYEEIFAMSKEEIANSLYRTIELLENEDLLKQYIKEHSKKYGMNDEFSEIKENFEWIQRCFAKTLSEMVIYGQNNIVCEWV